jgi:hypothetical protein
MRCVVEDCRYIERLELTIEELREEIIELKDVIEELKKGGDDEDLR